MSDYLNAWKPGNEICIIFDDKTAVPRTPEEINKLFTSLQSVAHAAGFDLSTWGLRPSFEKSIGKKVTRQQIKDIVGARDHQLAQLYPACAFLETNAPACLPEINLTETPEHGKTTA